MGSGCRSYHVSSVPATVKHWVQLVSFLVPVAGTFPFIRLSAKSRLVRAWPCFEAARDLRKCCSSERSQFFEGPVKLDVRDDIPSVPGIGGRLHCAGVCFALQHGC